MTFDELNEKRGGNEKPEDWRQHPNGGGWIYKTAKIGNDATVGNWATVGDDAKVGNWVKVGNRATVGDGAKVGNWATVGDGAKVGNRATVGNGATVGNWATVGDGAIFKKSPLYIIGTRHCLSNCKPGYIQIGCQCHTIKWWLAHVEECGKENGYTDDECTEYRAYVELFAKLGK